MLVSLCTDEKTDLVPTPRYNTAVLQDMIHCKHTEHVLQHIHDSQGVRGGIALLKVWLHQRQLDLVFTSIGSNNIIPKVPVCQVIHSLQLTLYITPFVGIV